MTSTLRLNVKTEDGHTYIELKISMKAVKLGFLLAVLSGSVAMYIPY
jgi:hypothetical protein